MVRVLPEGGGLRVSTGCYNLSFLPDRPFAVLADGEGDEWATLCLAWSLHTLQGLDDTTELGPPAAKESSGGVRVTMTARSSVWERKELIVDCREESVRFRLAVAGRGLLTDAHLFGGYYSAGLRWSSGFLRSGAAFRSVFNPEPDTAERRAVSAAESAVLDAQGTSLPGRGHWFFTPAPFCYGLGRKPAPMDGSLPEGPWLMLGLDTPPGEHHYTAFHYDGGGGAFSLRLAYEGQTAVDGAFTTPSTIFLFGAPDPYAGLAAYVAALREPGTARTAPRQVPDWWRRPIFCGWGAQCALAARQGGRAVDYCRREHYDGFLASLSARGLSPGTVVLDDKWQRRYALPDADPDKWPDLAAWIAARHAEGQRVLLWWKAWDPEGLPAELCVRNAAGLPVAADPTHPGYEEILRACVRRMLGADGYDADGLKVDFTARTPSGPGLRRHGREWGVELLHRLLRLLYDEAKRVKPDALVITHAANPYFADVSDMVRLNDINTGAPVVRQMIHRARVARAACPGALIDTDNWPMPGLAAWRQYLELQSRLGVPSLYYATGLDGAGEQFGEEDYAALRRAWAGRDGGDGDFESVNRT